MGKILRSLRYGNAKTRKYILIIFFCFIFGGTALVLAFLKSSMLWGMGACFLFVMGIVIMQSVAFKNQTNRQGQKEEKESTEEEDSYASKKNKEKEDNESEAEIDTTEKYTKDAMEKIFIKYKVKKQHSPVMIDSCASKKVHQCPAYFWVDKNKMYFLLLEDTPRKLDFPLPSMIHYEPSVEVFPQKDYALFMKPSFLSAIFGSLQPVCNEEVRGGRRIYVKNLYVLSPDIKVTNTSARVVMQMVQGELNIDDLLRGEQESSLYFKHAYRLYLLFRDSVLTVSEYKNKIKQLLQSMAEAEVSYQAFFDEMNLLVKYHMITKKYAEYYVEYRKKRTKGR